MNLLDVLFRPRDFFTALREKPVSHTRYLWLALLAGLVSGLQAALSQKPVQEALGNIPGLPGGGAFGLGLGVITAIVLTLVMWLMLWGLGSLGAGQQGRAAEVYGAALLPSLVTGLILLPLTALFPIQVNVPPLNTAGLEGPELATAMQKQSLAIQNAVKGQPLPIITNVLSYASMAWMFYLAWVGFGVLTGDRARSLRGVLIPLAVFLLLGLAFWLVGRALSNMMGGLA